MPTRELVSRDLHRVQLGEQDIDYVLLRRRGRRGIGLKVDPHGLTVSAPLTFPLPKIESFLREHGRWVLKKVAEWGTRRVPEATWHEGTRLPYLGGHLVLRIRTASRAGAELVGSELHVAVRTVDDASVQKAVVAWYKRAALAHLAQRGFAIARQGGLVPPRVFISSALSRWGSCNTRREVRFTWRLVKAPPALIDYVVAHELGHLRHMNHSAAFWAEVARLCPDYKAHREALHDTDHLYRSF